MTQQNLVLALNTTDTIAAIIVAVFVELLVAIGIGLAIGKIWPRGRSRRIAVACGAPVGMVVGWAIFRVVARALGVELGEFGEFGP